LLTSERNSRVGYSGRGRRARKKSPCSRTTINTRVVV
jgi:hypothetical protein